jgi:hypothetical protein
MSIPCPPIRWPSTLEDAGPPEDPTILLSATAQVAGTPFRLTAIRVDPRLRFMPDYQQDVDPAAYPESLEALLEDVGNLSDTDCVTTIRLETGPYVMWMAPAQAMQADRPRPVVPSG